MAVYFDATTLRALPGDLANPDLVRLKEAATQYQVGLFVPTVAKREWVVFHQDVAARKYEQIASAARAVGQYLNREPLGFESVDAGELEARVDQTLSDRLRAATIVEIPTVRMEQDVLIEMAVRKVKPFKEGDKGFRDTLIVETIAQHAQQFRGHSILVVSNDDVFSSPEVLKRWSEMGVHPIVSRTLEAAVTQLEAQMDEAWKRYLDQEAKRIKDFLTSRQNDVIFPYLLQNVEVSESFIRGGLLMPTAYVGTLERVRQVRPLEITRVSRGHILGPRESEGQRTPITFYVKVAFDITVRTYVRGLGDLLGGGPRFRLGDAAPLPVEATYFGLREPEENDITVEREISVEAWVTEDGTGEYGQLEIIKAATW